MTKVSVCIPTYNGKNFIQEQIDSILNQLSPTDEIIISDDSSTDGTVELIKAYKDPRIRLLESQCFSSPVFNLENALKHADGDCIFLADQDDIWESNKVTVLVEKLKTNMLVVSDGKVIHHNGETIAPSVFEILKSKNGFWKNIVKNSYMGCCMAFRKELLAYVLPFPKGIAMHDLWIGLNAEFYSKPCFCPEKLIRYRRHPHNKTPLNAETNTNPLWFKLSFRVKILFLLAQRFLNLKWENGKQYWNARR